MDVKILTSQEFLVVGMSFYGDPVSQVSGWSEDNEIGILWKRFLAFNSKNDAAIKHRVDPDALWEIHIYTKETTEKGVFEVFVGAMVDNLEDVPVECVVKILPATQYAMPSSGYCQSHEYVIQYYDQRFKGLDKIEESMLDAYVPVKSVE
jgi:predicted transcriptional regulator YdeE